MTSLTENFALATDILLSQPHLDREEISTKREAVWRHYHENSGIVSPRLGYCTEEIGIDQVEELHEDHFEVDGEEWRALTDVEADSAASDSLDGLLDDMLHDLPDFARNYFDADAWKRDVILSDGRGHVINSYDGAEEEQTIAGEWIFLYRQN